VTSKTPEAMMQAGSIRKTHHQHHQRESPMSIGASSQSSSRKRKQKKCNYPSIKAGSRQVDRANQNFPPTVIAKTAGAHAVNKPALELSIMERYLQSQRELAEKCAANMFEEESELSLEQEFYNEDSKLLSPLESETSMLEATTPSDSPEDSDDIEPKIIEVTEQEGLISPEHELPVIVNHDVRERLSRGSADGESGGTVSDGEMDDMVVKSQTLPPNINKINKNIKDTVAEILDTTWTSVEDAPRALLRGGNKNTNALPPKSNFDSMILRTLEQIEQSHMSPPADRTLDRTPISKEACMFIKEMVTGRGACSYDSLSSNCSSSLGELKRAYEFGKKWGLQDYQLPAYLADCEEKYQTTSSSSGKSTMDRPPPRAFAEGPRDVNDIQVQIPLPLRVQQALIEQQRLAEEAGHTSSSQSDTDANKTVV